MNKKQQEICDQLPGWCSAAKRNHMLKAVKLLKPTTYVELGVFGGSSLIPVALAIKGRVVGIDPWTIHASQEDMRHPDNLTYWGNEEMYPDVYGKLMRAIEELKITNVELVRNSSENVSDMFLNDSINMLHIDGNHSKIPCQRDFELYLPKVKIGSIIYADDYGWSEPDEAGLTELTVKPAVDWACEHGCMIVDEVDGCVVLKKMD